ncbi:hypothetical protein [Raoultella planticola]
MAKETKSVLADDLNVGGAGVEDLNAEDLNAGEGPQDNQVHIDTNADGSSGDDGAGDDGAGDDSVETVSEPEFVVLKGNSIRHDGEVYRENTRIPVTGTDADRLLAAGVIADVQVLRQRVLSAAPAVSVTTE